MNNSIKTLYKVEIFVDDEFVSYGEFVKEGCLFSLVSNYSVFDGHYNEDGFYDERLDRYVYPEFFLIGKKAKTKFEEIEL